MMKAIISSSLRFRYLVLALSVVLTWFGLARLQDVAVDVFPEFAPPSVEIQTICLGLSAAEVEQLVTVPLENALNGVPGVDVMRSNSVPQLSSIVLIFKLGADEIRARQMVSERMAIATNTLPTWAAPPFMMPPLSSLSRIMKVGITSKDKSVMDLSMLTYWTIRQRLLGVPGVANIAIWGEQLKMLQVMVDPKRLTATGVTLDEVQDAVSDALDVGLLRYAHGAHIGTGGFVETPNQRFQLRFAAAGVTPETLAQVPVTKRSGKPLLLRDVADLVYAPPGMIGDAVINDGPGLMLVVEKFPWGNTLAITRGVEQALEAMKPGLPGVEIDTAIFRPATFIEDSIDNLSRALLLGCVLVMGIIVVFLYEWRTAVVCIIAIPLSLLAAGLVLFQAGATVNTMILSGFVIALGIVVDDAILDVENIMRRLRLARRRGDTQSSARIILNASLEMRAPIVYATLIVVVAVVPVLFMEGVTGSFFKPLIAAYMLAIAASLVVAMTVTPALCLILLRNARLEGRDSPVIVWLQRGYAPLLERATRTPRAAFITVGVVTLAGIGVWPLLGQSLMPSFKERDFMIHWVSSPGTSLPEVLRIETRASKELRAIPGVHNFGAHIGQAFAGGEVAGVNFGENWISIGREADYDKTHARIGIEITVPAGTFKGCVRVGEQGPLELDDITDKIWCPDPAVPYAEVPELITKLRDDTYHSHGFNDWHRDPVPFKRHYAAVSLAIEFAILTVTRQQETLRARFDEIDLDKALWIIPKSRMKAKREFWIPLSRQAMTLVRNQAEVKTGEFIFPGHFAATISPNLPLEVLHIRGAVDERGRDATLHGFRSSFRDWSGNETDFARETAEEALSHAVGDMTERSYRRGNALDKRSALLQAWADYVAPTKSHNQLTKINGPGICQGH